MITLAVYFAIALLSIFLKNGAKLDYKRLAICRLQGPVDYKLHDDKRQGRRCSSPYTHRE
jgi:hypothetical protein